MKQSGGCLFKKKKPIWTLTSSTDKYKGGNNTEDGELVMLFMMSFRCKSVNLVNHLHDTFYSFTQVSQQEWLRKDDK